MLAKSGSFQELSVGGFDRLATSSSVFDFVNAGNYSLEHNYEGKYNLNVTWADKGRLVYLPYRESITCNLSLGKQGSRAGRLSCRRKWPITENCFVSVIDSCSPDT